jgi:hypothetical protein
MDELNKDQITRQLQAIHNEINLGWKESKVASIVKNNVFSAKFDHFHPCMKAKFRTQIIIEKIEVQIDEPEK